MKRKGDFKGSTPSTPGQLLRAWRERVAELSQTDVGVWFAATGAAVSNWESDSRRTQPDDYRLQKLDDEFGAGGAFIDLTRCLGTPRGLPPRTNWDLNFQPGGGAVWVWLRPGVGVRRLDAILKWGPATMTLKRRCSADGMFVTSPASISNPPLRVTLSQPGWVDYGRGHIPKQLGYEVISGIPHVRLDIGSVTTRLFWSSYQRLRGMLAGTGGRQASVDDSLILLDSVFEQLPLDRTELDLRRDHRSPIGAKLLTGQEMRQLRESRALRISDVVGMATAMDKQAPVSWQQVDSLEHGGQPRVGRLRSRLDVIYRGNGFACCERVDVVSEGIPQGGIAHYEVSFPNYWVGPVWLTALPRGTSDLRAIGLLWGPWRSKVDLQQETTLTFRCAEPGAPHLNAYLPKEWGLEAGIGVRPDAVDINDVWSAADADSARGIYEEMRRVYLGAVGGTRTGAYEIR